MAHDDRLSSRTDWRIASRPRKADSRSLALASLLFVPAGTLAWWPGWLFLGVLFCLVAVSALYLWRTNPAIFAARRRIHPATKRWDRILLGVLLPVMLSILPVAAVDAGRLAWSRMPCWLVGFGYILLTAGIALTAWAQRVNPFFEPGVRIQVERGHRVVQTGPYAVVRHPGYVGACLLFLGMALALGSWWALGPAALAVLLLVVRTQWEDRTLNAELTGYAAYAARVRFRLIPGVW